MINITKGEIVVKSIKGLGKERRNEKESGRT
jgi:hypothetical protein